MITLKEFKDRQDELDRLLGEARAAGFCVDWMRAHNLTLTVEVGSRESIEVIFARAIAESILGPAGGRSPLGGSFDWEVYRAVSGSAKIVLKSHTSDEELHQLQKRYAGAGGGSLYDWR